jgi:hypothetical protein
LIEAGYEVWANTDASGTFTDKLAADANRRMEQAGVHLMGMFGIAMDLMRDWRNTPVPLRFCHFWIREFYFSSWCGHADCRQILGSVFFGC